jgi:nucleoside diphosphate kinase
MHGFTLMLHSGAFQISSSMSMLELIGAGGQNSVTGFGEQHTLVIPAHRMLQQRSSHCSKLYDCAESDPPTFIQLLFHSYLYGEFSNIVLRLTNHKDKIFGLLGIAANAKKLDIKPDYERTWQELYIEASTSVLRHTNELSLARCQ